MVRARSSGPSSSAPRGRSSGASPWGRPASSEPGSSWSSSARSGRRGDVGAQRSSRGGGLPRRPRGSAIDAVWQARCARWCPACELRSPWFGGRSGGSLEGRGRSVLVPAGRGDVTGRRNRNRDRADRGDRARGAARRRRLAVVQRHRAAPQPGRQRLVADRGAAEAPRRPHPEPGGDREGLRVARAGHARGGGGGSQRQRQRQHPGRGGGRGGAHQPGPRAPVRPSRSRIPTSRPTPTSGSCSRRSPRPRTGSPTPGSSTTTR